MIAYHNLVDVVVLQARGNEGQKGGWYHEAGVEPPHDTR